MAKDKKTNASFRPERLKRKAYGNALAKLRRWKGRELFVQTLAR